MVHGGSSPPHQEVVWCHFLHQGIARCPTLHQGLVCCLCVHHGAVVQEWEQEENNTVQVHPGSEGRAGRRGFKWTGGGWPHRGLNSSCVMYSVQCAVQCVMCCTVRCAVYI